MKRLILLFIISFISVSCGGGKTTKAGYSGEDVSAKAVITRDKATKTATVEVLYPGEWELYGGPSVAAIDFGKPMISGKSAGVFRPDVPTGTRTYFQFARKDSEGVLAETHLPMIGGYNFRDLGGIRAIDGRYVKWGTVIRSDDLAHLTDADLEYLSSVPLASIVDFRSESEAQAAPDRVPASVKNTYALSITPGNLNSAEQVLGFDARQMDSVMMDMNRMFVSDSACVARYREFFGLLQEGTKIPLLFHCSAGKDRAGMGAALFLYSLGIDEDVIVGNYLESNRYLADKYTDIVGKYPQLEPLFTVRKEYLEAGLEVIKRDYVTVENYLERVLGVDLDKMKELYLF